MLLNESAYRIELRSVETSRLLESNRIEPNFCYHVFASHMNMRRFTAVEGNEKETVGTYPQYRRHRVALYRQAGSTFNRMAQRFKPLTWLCNAMRLSRAEYTDLTSAIDAL
jgi:hypothetical protein